MAASSYTDMKQRWQDALATDDTDSDFLARLPDIIGDAELTCYRDLDPLYTRKNAQPLSIATGIPTVALPSDCWTIRRVVLLTGTVRAPLLQRQASFLEEYAPDTSTTGTPKYWAMPAEGTLQLAPAPVAGSSLLIDYQFLPATMSASNPTTWLATTYPDLLFFAGMIWLAGWTKNYGTSADDPGGLGHYQARYAAALGAAKLYEARKKGDSPMEIGPTPAIPVTGG